MELAYESFTLFEKIYWVIAVVGSIILVILLIMTFIGGELDDIEGDVDTKIDGDTGIEFQFYPLRTLSVSLPFSVGRVLPVWMEAFPRDLLFLFR